MKILKEIQNWLEEFKTKYKPIAIYPSPKNPENTEEYFWELFSYYRVTRDLKEEDGHVFLGVEVCSIEEFAILVYYLKNQRGIKILEDGEFESDRYQPNIPMKLYDSVDDFYKDECNGVYGTELLISIDNDCFSEFWRNFWNNFILPCKYLLDSERYRQYLHKI